jgi:hypothetical protein
MVMRKKTTKDMMDSGAELIIMGFMVSVSSPVTARARMRCCMHEGFIFQWQIIIYPLAALAYFELLRLLDRYWSQRTPITDEEYLGFYAKSNAISEYEVFRRAAWEWSVNPTDVETDFRSYLQGEDVPHYVRDFIRKLKKDTQ